jgi:hypothetical protein
MGVTNNLALRPPRPCRAVGCVPEPACGCQRRVESTRCWPAKNRGSIHPVSEYSVVIASLLAEFYQRFCLSSQTLVHVVILVTFDVYKVEPHLPAGRKRSRSARPGWRHLLDEARSGDRVALDGWAVLATCIAPVTRYDDCSRCTPLWKEGGARKLPLLGYSPKASSSATAACRLSGWLLSGPT